MAERYIPGGEDNENGEILGRSFELAVWYSVIYPDDPVLMHCMEMPLAQEEGAHSGIGRIRSTLSK